MILHQPAGNYIEGYKKLEKAYKEGKLKSIGISNFNEEEIQEILDKTKETDKVQSTSVSICFAYN